MSASTPITLVQNINIPITLTHHAPRRYMAAAIVDVGGDVVGVVGLAHLRGIERALVSGEADGLTGGAI